MEIINLLIIDDHPDNIHQIKVTLKIPGICVFEAASYANALSLLTKHTFGLIIINAQINESNGFQVAENIRSRSEFKIIPIIFHSVNTQQKEYMFKGHKTGAVDYLFHPLNQEVILAKITSYIDVYRRNRSLEKTKDELERTLESLKAEIAERKETEGALRESRQQFKSLGENSPDIIYTLDFDGSFSYVNPAWEEILGHPVATVIGQYFIDFAQKPDKKIFRHHFKQIRDNKKVIRDLTGTLIHKNGSPHLFSLSGAPNIDSSGNVTGMVGLLKDITEQQKLQAQLLHAHKMEAIGTLAGGVAHDFNNLLQAMQGYAELLLLGMKKNDSSYNELSEIKRTAIRGAELTKQLLTFSRKVESKLRPININLEIIQIKKLLLRTIPKMIQIKLSLAEDIKIINGDPTQIEQVLMNLGVNARDAMPDGGTLLLKTGNIQLDHKFCSMHPGLQPGNYVCLTVSDSGCGMTQETCEHIFEPFYTTKSIGKGTGLGLSIVYGIIKNHGGYILCESEPDKGTKIIIYLPVLDQDLPGETKSEKENTVNLFKGSETILIVDDDAYIRQISQQVFEKFGYKTIGVASGEKALELYQAENTKVDLIILDLIMPGMGGKNCLEQLLQINPDEKVIIITGYSLNDSDKTEVLAKAKSIITKPYGTNLLLKTARKVLDGL